MVLHLTLGVNTNYFSTDLENYNGWNLPFAKSVFLDILTTEDQIYMQNNTFRLGASMNDYFGVIFTGRPLPLGRDLT